MRTLHGVAFLALIAALAAGYLVTLQISPMFGWDEAEYANLARAIVNGDPYTNPLRPPMQPLGGALLIELLGDGDYWTLKYFVLGCGILSLFLVGVLVAKIAGRETGLAAVGIFGTLHGFWFLTGTFLSEMPFIVFFSGAVLSFYLGLNQSYKWLFLSWLFIGLAFLTRYTALLIGPLMVMFVVMALMTQRHRVFSMLRQPSFWLSPLLGLLVLTPWLLHQQQTHGDFLIGFRIASQQLPVYLPNLHMPWHYYLSSLPQFLGLPALALFVAGAVVSVVRKDRFGLYLLATIVFVMLWFSLYRYKELRLLSALLPMFAIVGAIGFIGLIGKQRAQVTVLAVFVVSAAAGASTFFKSQQALSKLNSATLPLRDAAVDLYSLSAASAIVVTASVPQVLWYAKRTAVPMPASRERFSEILDESDWVLFTSYEAGQAEYAADMMSKLVGAGLPNDAKDGALYGSSASETALLIRATILRDYLTLIGE